MLESYPQATEADDKVQSGGGQYSDGSGGAPNDVIENTPEEQRKFVNSWLDRIKSAKKFHERAFMQMDENMDLSAKGAEKAWLDNKQNYVVPVLNRLINITVSQLYGRNPTAEFTRRERMMYTVWDGNLPSLREAEQGLQMAMQTGMPPDPNMQAILNDAEAVKAYDIMMDGVGKTLTILFKHYLSDPAEMYKQQFKALVRRAKVVGVGWTKLNFQRILEKNPDITTKIDETSQQIATIQRLLNEVSEDELPSGSPGLEELKQTLAALQSQETLIVKEGPFFSFPLPKKVIVDPACRHLKTLLGANWIAEEMDMTPDDIQENWKVDVGTAFTSYKPNNDSDWTHWSEGTYTLEKATTGKVYRVQNRKMGVEFVILEGYPAYLKAPATPKIKLPRFYDLFPLVFNEVEHDRMLYPPSDVQNARHLQNEYNRTREFLREHRQQNRPAYVTARGSFQETDLKKLSSHESGEIIELDGMLPEEDVAKKLQSKPTMQIDPRQYEVEGIYSDMLRVTGAQQANVGQTGDATATESSIAEQSRQTDISDHQDDLDDYLTILAQAAGVVMLAELSQETVIEIVGPGAKWPEMPETREEIAEEITLETRAGASGRPNQAAELAKLERGMPQLLQLPGVNPIPLAQRYVDVLELDMEDTIIEGLPSIASVNQQAAAQAKIAASASNAPEAQGPQGANNAPQPPGQAPGPQPAMPAPRVVHFDQQGNPHGGFQPQQGHPGHP